MRPILFTLFGFPIQSYGVSKVLAALAAAWLLGQAFVRRGLIKDDAHGLVVATTLWGFAGAKMYYLAEHPGEFGWHHLSSGFTWYGGFLAGTGAALVVIHRRRLPLATVAGLSAVPLAVAYGLGRLGCLLAGDGTYGKPSGLPWAMAFPNGTVPTDVPVQPTPLYEALIAFGLAVGLWWLGRRVLPLLVFAAYLVGSGTARFAVEFLRVNQPVWLGLTAPQLWSLALVAAGGLIAVRTGRRPAVPALPDLGRTPSLSP
jgi:phosphatidylglycerol---prolipoprotein diacylglyceryl transferase